MPSPIDAERPDLPSSGLLVIFGAPAVGKMTVGEEVARRTGFRLFHNHMSLDVVSAVFEWGSPPFGRLVAEIRHRIMEEAADARLRLLFTFAWDFADPGDRAVIDTYQDIFRARGGDTLFVELVAEQSTRFERNRSEHRARMKRRSAESSTAEWIAEIDARHQLDSGGEFPYPDRYLRIDNTHLDPAAVAERIVAHFGL